MSTTDQVYKYFLRLKFTHKLFSLKKDMIIYFHSTLNQIKLYEYFCYVEKQYLLKLDIARLHFGEKATFKKTTTKIYIIIA